MRRGASTTVLLVVLVGTVWGLMHLGWYSHGQITDYGVYAHYGDAIVHTHAVPYRDFPMEYPPAALPVFVAPALLERFNYDRVFQVLMALCDVGAVLAVALVAGRKAAVAAAVAPLALGSVVLSRFDFWPAGLAALGIAALLRGRSTTSALLLGTAFAAKLWPAVLVPLVVVWLARTRGPRAAGRWAAEAAFVAFGKVFSPQFLIWLIPLVVLVRGRRAHLALPLFALALVFTQLWFPRHYWDLALRFASPYSWLLLVRDLAVVALVAAFVWPRSQHELLGEHRSRLEALQRVRAEIQ